MEPTDELVTVARYRDLPTAVLARMKLDSAGLACLLADENVVGAAWFYSNAVGGIRLQVRAEDRAEVLEILNEAIPEQFDWQDSGGDAFIQPRCPHCNSVDTSLQTRYSFWTLFVTYQIFGFCLPFKRESWVCGMCDARWAAESRA